MILIPLQIATMILQGQDVLIICHLYIIEILQNLYFVFRPSTFCFQFVEL